MWCDAKTSAASKAQKDLNPQRKDTKGNKDKKMELSLQQVKTAPVQSQKRNAQLEAQHRSGLALGVKVNRSDLLSELFLVLNQQRNC